MKLKEIVIHAVLIINNVALSWLLYCTDGKTDTLTIKDWTNYLCIMGGSRVVLRVPVNHHPPSHLLAYEPKVSNKL